MSCPHEGSALLFVPLSALCHMHIASAISLAEHMGEHAAKENILNILGERSKEVFAEGDDYWAYVLLPGRERGEVSTEDFERWDKLFQNRTMLRDPRVQAFCASWSRTASELSVMTRMRHQILSESLQLLDLRERPGAPTTELEIREASPTLQPIFSRGADRFLVFRDEEAHDMAEDALVAQLHRTSPEFIHSYSVLPEGAQGVIEALQEFGEEANPALAALIEDIEEFTDSAIEEMGYGSLLAPWLEPEQSAQIVQAGDTLILRWRVSESPSG